MNEILRSTPATLQLNVYSGGTLTDLAANPTLVVTDGNGATVSSGAVSKPGAPDAVGVYRSVLPGQADLKVLDAAWTGTLAGNPVIFNQQYEIVGSLLFTEAEARAEQVVGGIAPLTAAKYSDEVIAHWRSVIGDIFESRLKRGVFRRYCRLELVGSGTELDLSYGYPRTSTGASLNRPGRIWDIARIISATVDGTAQTVGDITISGYKLKHTSWSGDVVVEYEYGPDPVDAEIHQRALDMMLANAAPGGFPSTATSISNEDGTFSITTFPAAVEDMFKHRKARASFGIA